MVLSIFISTVLQSTTSYEWPVLGYMTHGRKVSVSMSKVCRSAEIKINQVKGDIGRNFVIVAEHGKFKFIHKKS